MVRIRRILQTLSLAIIVSLGLFGGLAQAASVPQDPTQNPKSGAIGLEGTISTAPPTKAATITTPSNGASFTNSPITVAGLCPSNTLVKIFDNNVFVGSALCTNGSYTLQIDLFGGSNQLVARVYDALDQAGPDSNVVTVNYNDAAYAQFGTRVTITSTTARRGAFPGDELVWPLLLNGGVGPYAVSIDWGDGTPTQLISLSSTGGFNGSHTYTNAGYYKVVVRGTDKNGTTAFLQLVAVANGATQTGDDTSKDKNSKTATLQTEVLWWPVLLLIPLLFVTFWLGRRNELYVLRKELENAKQQ